MSKLNVIQRGDNSPGWNESHQFQSAEINQIKIINSSNARSLNAIPSPLARLHLIDAAFALVYQDELNGTGDAGDAYRKLVSDCLDVFELIYNWNTHIEEKAELKIVTWNKETETGLLKQEFLKNKEQKKEELRRNPDDKQSLGLQQIDGFKEYLVGDTLSLFLNAAPFDSYDGIHIILLGDKPLAGTSPLTGFFTTPNDLSDFSLINPGNNQRYFSRCIPFAQRDKRIRRFIYDFFTVQGREIFHAELPVSRYLQHHATNIPQIPLQLAELSAMHSKLFNEKIELRANAEHVAANLLENYLVRISYRLNDECFYVANTVGKQDRTHDYLLPLTPKFFKINSADQIPALVSIIEKDTGTVEVRIVRNGETFSKTYQSNRIDNRDGYLVDLSGTHSIKVGLGIFPFLKVEDDDTFNDFYKVMFVGQDNHFRLSNKDFQLKFGKDGKVIEPEENTVFTITRDERMISEKGKTLCGSTYYSLNFCFDFIQLHVPVGEHQVRCTIAPHWVSKQLGANQVDFAVDFGTTTTFVAYTDSKNYGTLPKNFELGHDEVPVALLNKPIEMRNGIRWIDRYEHSTVLPDFNELLEIQKHEFVPSLLNSDKYSFPFRTVIYEKTSVASSQKVTLGNTNIAFAYQKEFNSLGYGQTYLANLKWSINTDSRYKQAINVFIEELFHLMRVKTLLSDGDPRFSKISRFFPLSFSQGDRHAYDPIWTQKYAAIFKGDPAQLRSVTESEAPFYYYSKIMADENGAVRITDTSSVITLDIGGGTTDFMYFRNGNPVIGTSVRFGANVLWGNGYSEYINEKSNGIYRALKSKISDNLKSSLQKTLNEFLNKPESNFGSDEIINFWLSCNESNVTDELKSGRFRFSYLLHLSALIYHSCKLLQIYKHPSPECIIFTGNGSKYLDLIQTPDYIENICGFFVKEVFGEETGRPQVILPSKNRKEATCFGGLYQPTNTTTQFKPVSYSGFETETDSYKRYAEIDLHKMHVFDSLGATFTEFVECLFKMNAFPGLSFRANFSIDSNLMALKTFLLQNARPYLSTGYDRRRKTVSELDEVTDALFFYPLVGLLYQVNKLSESELGQYAPKTSYYAINPDKENSFAGTRLSTERKPESIFSIRVDSNNPDHGEIILIGDVEANQRAMVGINSFLRYVCDFNEFPSTASPDISVLEPGRVEREKDTDRWLIRTKIKIKFMPA